MKPICHAQAAAPAAKGSSSPVKDVCRVAVLGASGYTGAEVVRLTALHPHIKVTALTGEKQAGKVGGWCGGSSMMVPCNPAKHPDANREPALLCRHAAPTRPC